MQDFDDDLHVDLTPLIDVIFMLVIFFIMTMSFTLPVVEFNLPESSTAQTPSQPAMIRITIDKAGTMSVEQQNLGYAELELYIKEQVAKQGANLSLEVLIDANTPTQYLIKVADLARIYTQGRLSLISSKQESTAQGGFLEQNEQNEGSTPSTEPKAEPQTEHKTQATSPSNVTEPSAE